MADRYGTRRVFATAIGIFTLGSFLCGVASSIHMLVAARILQGCGGSMMVPVGRLTLVRTFERRELVRVLSFVSIPALVGPLVGPLAGGLIVGYLHWSLILLRQRADRRHRAISGAAVFARHRADKVDPLDVIGMVLFGAGVALLSYVLEIFGEHTLSVLEMTGLLALAATLLLAYWHHASRASHPMLRLELFRTRTFRVAVIGSFVTRLGAGGMPFPCRSCTRSA
jgi:MFS family permease